MADPCRWLLIGNSRWHWAEADGSSPPLRIHHRPAPLADEPIPWSQLRGWACVGRLPGWMARPGAAGPPPERRLALAAVPLQDMPPWLGIDRALGGWRAWCRQGGGGVLVADAGTALSLTRVSAEGRFAGGRLQAGYRLQLQALREATAQLPSLEGDAVLPADPWPQDTESALRCGCLRGLAAAIAQAWLDLPAGAVDGLWLTGGDGPVLAPLLRGLGVPVREAPGLCLEALVELSSAPGQPGSDRPSPRPSP
jgi:type III pantothenate kinase